MDECNQQFDLEKGSDSDSTAALDSEASESDVTESDIYGSELE